MTVAVRSAVDGIAWPGVPDAVGAQALALQWQLKRSQWWPADLIRARQMEQLRQLAIHALAHVPRYASLRDRFGDDAGRLDERSFLSWPVLTKEALRAEAASLHAGTYPDTHGAWTETLTSGSTGVPVRVRQTAMSSAIGLALVTREHLVHRRDLTRKFGAIRLAAPGGTAPGWGVMSIAFHTGPSTSIDVLAGVAEQLDWLLAQAPAYLLAHPSNLRALIEESARTDRRPAGLLQLISFGEMMPPDLRTLARAEWGVDVVDTYSCREAGSLAFQCPASDAFHVNAEGIYLEVLREDGSPCGPGETGRVVITPLHNFAMPLLRYEIGDYAEVGEPCPCGRGLPVLKRIAGRVTNMAVDPTGRRFWPGLRASFLTRIAPFRQLRLVQHDVATIELCYVLERDLTTEEQAAASRALADMLGYPFRVRFSRVPSLPRGPGGKYEDFVSLLERR